MSYRVGLTMVLVVLSWGGELFAAAPAPEDAIARAVRQLGDTTLAGRDKATAELLAIGWPARPALRQASKSTDAEVARRARAILAKQKGTVPPGTSAAVAKLYAEWIPDERQGGKSASVLHKLCGHYGDAYPILADLLVSEDEPAIRKYLARSGDLVSRISAYLFAEGKVVEAEELLENKFNDPGPKEEQNPGRIDFELADYAAMLLLRPRLSEKCALLRERMDKRNDARAATVLAYVYRSRGDLKEARWAAEKAGNPKLLQHILEEQEDWARLTTLVRAKKPHRDRWDEIFYLAWEAGLHQRAGESAQAVKAIAELRQWIPPINEESKFLPIVGATALLLNERPPAEALTLLADHKENLVRFQLLCAQMRFKEAFALQDRFPTKSSWFKLSRARAQMRLGEQQQAVAGLEWFFTNLKGTRSPTMYAVLLEAETRMGLRALAVEHCERGLALKTAQMDSEGSGALPLKERLVGETLCEPSGWPAAELWWSYFARRHPDKIALGKVCAVLDGQIRGNNLTELCRAVEREYKTRTSHFEPEELTAAFTRVADRAGESALARSWGEKWAALDGVCASREGSYFLGNLAARERRWSDAVRWYRQAWERRPNDAWLCYLHGWALEQAGTPDEGRRRMRLAHAMPLGDVELRHDFAKELAKPSEFSLAQQEFERVINGCGLPDDIDKGEALAALGRAAAHDGRFDKAANLHRRVCLNELEYNNGDLPPGLYLILPHRVSHQLARAHLAAGRTVEARQAIRRCLDLLPGNLDLPLSLVPALETKGLRADADQLFDTVFNLHDRLVADYPRCAWAHHHIAWLCLRCGRKIDRALTAAGKAIELEPTNALYRDTRAEIQFQRGQQEEAVEEMKHCLRLNPESVYFAKQLARFRAGNPKAALPTELAGVKKTEEACLLSHDYFATATGFGIGPHTNKNGTGSFNFTKNSYYP